MKAKLAYGCILNLYSIFMTWYSIHYLFSSMWMYSRLSNSLEKKMKKIGTKTSKIVFRTCLNQILHNNTKPTQHRSSWKIFFIIPWELAHFVKYLENVKIKPKHLKAKYNHRQRRSELYPDILFIWCNGKVSPNYKAMSASKKTRIETENVGKHSSMILYFATLLCLLL